MRSENAEGSGNHTGLRSDSLPSIVRALEALPELQSLISPKLIRLAVVVDASVINAELRWRLARRRRPENRSALFEAVDAGVVTLVAPLFLAAEIEEHLVEIAAQTGSSVEAAMVEWKAIRPKLRFYAPPYGTPVSNVVDPDDIAYVDSSKALGLPVYTRDAHFQTMGAPAVLDRIDLELRDHARGITMTLTFTVGSAAALAGIFAILRQALVGVRGLLGAFSSLPDAVQALLIGGVLVALACPASRAKLSALWNRILAKAADFMAPLGEMALASISAYAAAEAQSEAARRIVTRAMPAGDAKHTARVLVRRACFLSSEPLSVAEITQRLTQYGYVSRAKNHAAYIRRILRESDEFLEIGLGRWTFRPLPKSEAPHMSPGAG